jgi:DNA (cytosine-5)-methyltransferase 1
MVKEMKTFSVADFFCGAGGFSEGFRRAGFEVNFGLDNWSPAVDTFKFNYPDSSCIKMDILKLNPKNIDEIVPDTDVIIGSPPCVAFSNSNRSGKGNHEFGIALIKKFLQVVAIKKNNKGSLLKFWVLENVPKSSRFIKESYTFKDLGLPGGAKVALKINRRLVLNSAEYGVPQTRYRLFYGDFPEPTPTHSAPEDWVKLGSVQRALGAPLKTKRTETIDPNYSFRMKSRFLTDHYYDTCIAGFEWKKSKRLKLDHSYMGRMSFPENPARPSRTILATCSAVSREAMILSCEGSKSKYRLPTIREIACLMSFPITYQFIGLNEADKYRLVGNAVCPKISYAIAKAMMRDLGLHAKSLLPESLDNLEEKLESLPFNLNGYERKKKRLRPRSMNSRFRDHVPSLKIRGFRVDLDNLKSDFERCNIVWKVTLHQGSGKDALKSEPKMKQILCALEGNIELRKFEMDLKRRTLNKLPKDSLSFQRTYCRLDNSKFGPEEALDQIRILVDSYFPDSDSDDAVMDNSDRLIPIDHSKIPLKILAALYSVNRVVDVISSRR